MNIYIMSQELMYISSFYMHILGHAHKPNFENPYLPSLINGVRHGYHCVFLGTLLGKDKGSRIG